MDAVAARMAAAARELLDSLDEPGRAVAQWPFPSDEERHRWYYTPTDHGGLPLLHMRPASQQLAMALVATGLSRPAYATAASIMGLEHVLGLQEGWTRRWGREHGRDPALYYVRVFGDPGGGAPWSWRFGGHHVSVHHLIVDGRVQASTPCFFGADPASTELLGPDRWRPLAGVEDLARALVRSLDPDQLARALLSNVAPLDLAGANRPRLTGDDLPLRLGEVFRGTLPPDLQAVADRSQAEAERAAAIRPEHLDQVRLTATPRGIPASALTPTQRDGLRALLDLYLRRLPDELAAFEQSKYAGERLNGLHFAWAGGFAPGQAHYYRVQGPRLLLEYDNATKGANHVHSVWRDPEGDFGDDVLARHHRDHHGQGVAQ